jgi:hypothetical protein
MTPNSLVPSDIISALLFAQTQGGDAFQSDPIFQKLCQEKEP